MQQSDNTQKEKNSIIELLEKFPESCRHIFDNSYNISCIYLGEGEVPPGLYAIAKNAKLRLEHVFGKKLSLVFDDLHIYFVNGIIQGGGVAYSGANAIIIDVSKALMTIQEAEDMLGPGGMQILDPEDWTRVHDSAEFCGEITMVHEIGHILQAKTHTKTTSAPTKYAKKNEWEAYAESFLYYCYHKPMQGDGEVIIKHDIERV